MTTKKKRSSVSNYLQTVDLEEIRAAAPTVVFSEESRRQATYKRPRKPGSFVGAIKNKSRFYCISNLLLFFKVSILSIQNHWPLGKIGQLLSEI